MNTLHANSLQTLALAGSLLLAPSALAQQAQQAQQTAPDPATVPATATATLPDYSLVLVGGGLRTCSSQSRSACKANSTFAKAAKTTEWYALSLDSIRSISQAPVWHDNRASQRQQTQLLLSQLLADFGSAPMSETQLLQRWRAASLSPAGGQPKNNTQSGEALYQQLSEQELNLVLDMLQQPALGPDRQRQKEQASLSQTEDGFSVEIYNKISELAAKVRQNKHHTGTAQERPLILVVTASSRDPLAAVDFYQSAFAQTGARVQWLPLNAAYQAAWQQAGAASGHKEPGKAGAAACLQLPQYLADIHGSYNRGVVYPDLMQQLTSFCQQGPSAAVAQIEQADAVFFNGGDQSLTLRALRLADGSASPELRAISRQLGAGRLIVAGTSAGTAVQAGGSFAGQPVPMISNGSSRQALQTGAVAAEAPLAGCEKNQSCPASLAEDQLTYRPQGGLGLFPFGVTDTHFSERGREARLIRLLSDSKTRFGFGVDEATALLVGFDPADAAAARFAVTGAGGVFVADLATARASGSGADWQIQQVRTHYLSRDDRATLSHGQFEVQFAPWKQQVASSQHRAVIEASGDVLQQDNYRQLALKWCQSGQPVARGQSGSQNSTLKGPVQLQLSRQADTRQAAGLYKAGAQSTAYCSYQQAYLQISRAAMAEKKPLDRNF